MSPNLDEESLPALFTRQAAATPGRVAVRCRGEELSYAELDERSARLAALLRELGVTAEEPVGVLMDRSMPLVVSLLAVLRAGGCYLALDPDWPPARSSRLLTDAGAKVVLTQRPLADRLATGHTTLALDDPALTLPPPGPDAPLGPDALAYIAYTSGSTGTPKGVCVPHRAVVRLVRDADFLRLSADDVFLQYAPVAFDASTLELWAPLLNGAQLCVPPPGALTPAELAEVVRAEAVSVLWLTAGLFHQVVDAALDALTGLRYLIAGGDVLSPSHVGRAVTGLPGTTVINGYGPTENTTFTCCHPMTSVPATPTVPIGRPIRGTEVRLLDAEMVPVPEGETGELYASGLGLARGYLGRPVATADAFLPDPFGPPGSRMYRTGDLARRLPGGDLVFVGRADRQVKVRGFRVEPAEVEAAVLRRPGVAEAAVVAQPDTRGGQRLVAFYTSDFAVSAAALRRGLAGELPGHLVPSLFTRLEAMPLTGSGKVDRAALAARPVRRRPELDTEFRRPAGLVETWLARMWGDVLEIDPVGVDDDFFELGGHSLLASQITTEIGTELGIPLRARTFYENPTIAELALHLDEIRKGGAR
ncbi:non-ribosomal peptide synthetase [Streptomyces litchfieldiae]|uniref:Non-ribosomal peptide synthetase n=1 Tax=Streptomyces litchfieldiae TaxID=3075543 RepID=A0ABU2MQM2_9ACTN|nr:non-ribosomal peptide synthetase [Streptomyces sp. DSM 44938]MDT0343926.1 non-ribosomal peptide synthetase [Streptomyces sp. DSM 44938]